MNILIGGPFPYKDSISWGGVEKVIQNLQIGFNENYDSVILNIISGSKEAKEVYDKYQDIIYIRQSKINLGSVFLSSYPFLIKKILNKTDFDVFNAHSVDFGYYGLNNLDRLLYTMHGITWEEEKFLSWKKQIGWNLFYVKRINKILKKIKYFVSINPYSKKLIENKTKAQIFDICNPIPNHYFKVKNKNLENRIFYLGVISNRKNLFGLIKSLKFVKQEIQHFKLIIAGKISDKNYFNILKEFIHKYDLDENVEILGPISEEKKLEEYSKMSFLVLPSLQETAPMVISEAFASGKPVIASNICGIPYMLNKEKNGILINPNNEKNIAEAIIYLFNNQSEIRKKGMSAESYAKKNYSLNIVTKKYKAAYEEISRNI